VVRIDPGNISTTIRNVSGSAVRNRDVNRDPSAIPTIDHRERLWDRAGEIAADPFQILYQKNYALCGNCLNLEFGLIQPLRRLSICCCPAASRRRY
jgi:hypothetical protein